VEYCFLQEDWTKAKYYCKWLGMELVSIESEEENLAITAALGKLLFWCNYINSFGLK
jgi:hypothetical protein